MSKKKCGDLLEQMIYVLEKSFSNSLTKIIKKYKLKDSDGINRELDIYCEVMINGKLLRYAFECKNHKHPIQLKDLVDFQSKIKDKGIKGYFVTTSNYQSGVVQKAKALEIDLLKLKTREPDDSDLRSLIIVKKAFQISNIELHGHYPDEKPEANWLDKCRTCHIAVLKIIDADLLPILESKIDQAIQIVSPDLDDIKKVSSTIGVQKARKLHAIFQYGNGSITHKGAKISIDFIKLDFSVWNEICQHKPQTLSTFNYLRNDNDIFAAFSFSEFVIEDQNIIVGITRAQDNLHKLSITSKKNLDDIQTSDMIYLGHIDELGLRQFIDSNEDDQHP